MVDTRPIRLQGFGLRFKTLFHALCLGIMAALRDFFGHLQTDAPPTGLKA